MIERKLSIGLSDSSQNAFDLMSRLERNRDARLACGDGHLDTVVEVVLLLSEQAVLICEFRIAHLRTVLRRLLEDDRVVGRPEGGA